jgi:RNA polymerase sigma factor (sigma-70 family)
MEDNIDHNLIEKAKKGQTAAIAELFNGYWRAARAAAYGVTADISIAEDAACDAFYATIESLHKLKDEQLFGPWLRTIVIRKAKQLKAAYSKEKKLDMASRFPSANADDILEHNEMSALIYEAVGSLLPRHREAISLFYFEGYNIKDAAAFLGVPEGTFKRRLHEARQILTNSAVQIVQGIKPFNPKREQILRQLKDASDAGIHSEAFFQAARQVLSLRPVPNELFREVMQKHWAARKEKISSQLSTGKETQIRENITRLYAPSENANNSNHPVGDVAKVIRSALPEFQQWHIDWSKVNISKIVSDLSEGNENAFSFLHPLGFDESSEGTYICSVRALLVQDEDSSIYTTYQLYQREVTIEQVRAQILQGKRLSDTLNLLWKKSEFIELHEVENLLRRLADTIIPQTRISFTTYDDPRYRAALRMKLGDNPIPAAIGGVLASSLGLPDSIKVVSVTIYLEPWASARSGSEIQLATFI